MEGGMGRTVRGTQTQLTVLSVLTILSIVMSAAWMFFSMGTLSEWFIQLLLVAGLALTLGVMIVIIARRA